MTRGPVPAVRFAGSDHCASGLRTLRFLRCGISSVDERPRPAPPLIPEQWRPFFLD